MGFIDNPEFKKLSLILPLLLSYLFYIFASKIYFLANIRIKGSKSHPISLLILIQFCIFSLPGVVAVSFLGLRSERYDGINDTMLLEIGLWYLYSLIVFLLLNSFCLKLFRIKFYDKYVCNEINYQVIRKYIFSILFLSIIALIAKIVFSKTSPLFYLLSGNAQMAYSARIDIQTNPQDYYLPYVSNIVSLLSVYQFYFVYYSYTFSKKKNLEFKLCLLVSFILAAIECLYETQKAPIVFLLIGVIFITYLKNKAIIKLFPLFFIIGFFIILLQSYVIEADFFEALTSSMDRFLLGQNQGFYHIINSIKPDEKYWFTSFYFIEKLGVTTARADVDVIPFIDIYKYVDIVNVNSYYLGEAWSMFGYFGLILSPIIVAISVAIFIKILDLFIQYMPHFFIPYAIYNIPEFRINQAFNYFLYGKEFVFKLIMIFVIIYIIRLFSGFSSIRM